MTVPLERFDLAGLFDTYRAFYRCWALSGRPDQSLYLLARHGDPPAHMPRDVDPLDALRMELLVFVPAHAPVVGETVPVIDGSEVEAAALDIGSTDLYGFLVELHDGRVSVHPALYDGSSGPAPSLDIQGRCGVLDDRMAAFLREFVSD